MCVCVCELWVHVNKQQWVVVYMWLVSSVYLCSSHAVRLRELLVISTSLFNISSEDQTVLQLYAGGLRARSWLPAITFSVVELVEQFA